MNLAKTFLVLGVTLTAVGLCLLAAQKIPGLSRLGRLPGDIRVERENFSFYFPWVTCLLLSGLATLALRLFGRLK